MEKTNFILLDDYDIIKSILNEPELKVCTTGVVHLPFDIEPDPRTTYVGCTVENQLVGIIPCKPLTNITLECHIYVLRAFWGKDVGYHVASEFKRYIASQTAYTNAYSTAPANCRRGNELIKRLGAELIGCIPNGINYLGEVTDLNLYNVRIN